MLSSQRLWPRSWSFCVAFIGVHLLLFAKSAVSIPVSITLFGAPFAFVGDFQAHESDVSLVRANAIRCCFSTREKKVRIPMRLTSHTSRKSRICREFTTIRGKKRQRGKVKLTLLKPVFVDFQGSNFRFQSRGRNAELGCGT